MTYQENEKERDATTYTPTTGEYQDYTSRYIHTVL